MKIKDSTKNTLLGALIFLLVVFNVGNFFNLITMKEEISYINIDANKTKIEGLNNSIINNDKLITDNSLLLNDLTTQDKQISEKLKNLSEFINKNDLVYHFPSFIIILEQEANKNKLDFEVYYDKIKLLGNDSSMLPDMLPDMPPDMPDNNITVTPSAPPSSESVLNPVQESLPYEYVPIQIKNMNTAVVPIKITGDYENIRTFINFLDDFKYINPGYINIYLKDDKPICDISIEIIYGGDF